MTATINPIYRAAGQFGISNPMQMTNQSRITLASVAANQGSWEKLRIVGCPVPYGVLSCDLGGFREVYERGCFAASLANSDLRVLFNHNPDYVLGRRSASTALFYEGTDGLQCEADPPETAWANDLLVSMDRGDIDQMDAHFIVLQERWEYRGSERICIIEKAQLIEVSVASFAVYDAARAEVLRPGQDKSLAAGSFYLSDTASPKGISLQ